MNGNHRRVARRAFGNITIRRRPDGTIRSYRAGYNAPTDGRRVVRDFPTRAKADEWLEREAALDAAHRAGITRWTHPSQRERADRNADVTFHQWAGDWYRSRGRYDRHGNPLAPATLRVKDLAFQRLDRHFGRMRMKDITVRDVNRFLDRGLGSATADRNAYILLHRIMREAANPSDGSDPVIERDPCVRATPDKPEPAPPIPPATPEQLEAIRNAMPDKTRIAIDVAVAFALRAGEICALQVADFDLDNMTLHLRHAARLGREGVQSAAQPGESDRRDAVGRRIRYERQMGSVRARDPQVGAGSGSSRPLPVAGDRQSPRTARPVGGHATEPPVAGPVRAATFGSGASGSAGAGSDGPPLAEHVGRFGPDRPGRMG